MDKVTKIMNKNISIVGPEETVFEACKKMASINIGLLVIMGGERILGVFSERDVVNKVVAQDQNVKETLISDIMTTGVITVDPSTDLVDAWKIMKDNKFRHLPVVDENNKPIGIISVRDLIENLAINNEIDNILSNISPL